MQLFLTTIPPDRFLHCRYIYINSTIILFIRLRIRLTPAALRRAVMT